MLPAADASSHPLTLIQSIRHCATATGSTLSRYTSPYCPTWMFDMLGLVKDYLKTTPFYPYYFARKNALPTGLSSEERRYAMLYAAFVRDGSLVFDVGANIGVRVKVFRYLNCRVIAVEPQRNCVAALRRTFGSTITIVQAAVSDRAGMAELHTSDVTAISSLSKEWMNATRKSGRFAGLEWTRTERVHVTRIDSLIDRFGIPDFIKIDIEGHELAALRGLSTAVPALSFEFTPEIRETTVSCVNLLESLGCYEFNFSVGETAELKFPEWLERDNVVSFLRATDGYGDVYALRRSGDNCATWTCPAGR
jgi:FkbM family methyltransferase